MHMQFHCSFYNAKWLSGIKTYIMMMMKLVIYCCNFFSWQETCTFIDKLHQCTFGSFYFCELLSYFGWTQPTDVPWNFCFWLPTVEHTKDGLSGSFKSTKSALQEKNSIVKPVTSSGLQREVRFWPKKYDGLLMIFCLNLTHKTL